MIQCKSCGFEITETELLARFMVGLVKCPRCEENASSEVKTMDLFQLGSFILHSGKRSHYKIDCDALTDKDIEALAFMLNEKLPVTFGKVQGVPRGGLRLAKAMELYLDKKSHCLLIVDDVFTTGRSIEEHAKGASGYYAGVLFARGPCPNWVTPVFQY